MIAAAIAVGLHIFGAVVWVGGMFAVYVCLRPALGTVELAPRLRLMRATLRNFFLLLVITGYGMVFVTFGGFAAVPLHVNLMQAIGWVMIALFFWLFHGPWLAFRRAVDTENWPDAAASLDRIRRFISLNLPLGLIVVVIGASGRFWA